MQHLNLSNKTLVKCAVYLCFILMAGYWSCSPKGLEHIDKPTVATKPCSDSFLKMDRAPGFSKAYDRMVRYPSRLMEKENQLQTRPLYIWIAWVFDVFVTAFFIVFGLDKTLLGGYITEHFAYVLMNFTMLSGALFIFDRLIVSSNKLSWSIVALSTYLVFNGNVATFLWYPHSGMNHILFPLAAILISRVILLNPKMTSLKFFCLSLASGVSLLFYPTHVTLIPVMIMSYLLSLHLHKKTENSFKIPWKKVSWNIVFSTLLMILPLMLWIGACIHVGGEFSSIRASDKYRNFTWILDVFREGGFTAFFHHLSTEVTPKFLNALSLHVVQPYYFPLFTSMVVALITGIAFKNMSRSNQMNIIAGLIALLWIGLFFYFMPFYGLRLLWNLKPPLLFLIAVLMVETVPRLGRKRAFFVNSIVFLFGFLPFLYPLAKTFV
jgi:hypothetical protein